MTKAEKMELLYAALHDDDADEFKRLLALYPDCRLNDSGDDGWMDAAAMRGKSWAIEYLVAEGADINKPSNSTDSTPLPEGPIQWAASGGHLDTVVAESAAAPADPSFSSAWQRLQAQREQLAQREGEMIRDALAQCGGVISYAARELGMARTTLASRIEVLGVRGARREG